MDPFFPNVSYMVSLTEIGCSQDEMRYITRMRNVFKFRMESNKDYIFLNYPFRHIILCPLKRIPAMEACFRHTLFKVMNSLILLHNYTPFAQRMLVNIGEDRFPAEGNLGQPISFGEMMNMREKRESESNLIATLGFQWRFTFETRWCHWNILQSQLLRDTRLSGQLANNAKILNSMHTSGWRQLFADNFINFSCTDSDIASYIREQTELSRPVNVFKEIIERERGETFNPFRILESIASPYYYVLPQHGEGPHDLTRNIIACWWSLRNRGNPPPWDELFCFESEAKIARKKITCLEEVIY
ncbi:uncharacterized protein TNCT_462621 [Trichonephila clavata]|uniref:Uncharacterized protein n=1 Tax=Trichonephila clavata TaxID=2740835 RepID=A0A8X6LBL0_TRICU|nr:uncharacterized protein TNCT_462621 [Trichonephila clavata]